MLLFSGGTVGSALAGIIPTRLSGSLFLLIEHVGFTRGQLEGIDHVDRSRTQFDGLIEQVETTLERCVFGTHDRHDLIETRGDFIEITRGAFGHAYSSS